VLSAPRYFGVNDGELECVCRVAFQISDVTVPRSREDRFNNDRCE